VLEGRKPIFCCLTIDYMAGVDFLLYFVKLSFLLSSHFSVFLLVLSTVSAIPLVVPVTCIFFFKWVPFPVLLITR
jgi:hypothetical protein